MTKKNESMNMEHPDSENRNMHMTDKMAHSHEGTEHEKSQNMMDSDMQKPNDHMNHDMPNMYVTNNSHEGMSGHHMMMDMVDLNRRLWISIILTIPVVLLSPMAGMGGFNIHFSWSPLLLVIIGSILYFYGGKPFFSGAKMEVQMKQPGMMSLITLGITVAYFYSMYSVIANNIFHTTPMVDEFFWELSTLIDIMLLGHIIEMKSVDSAGSAVDSLAKLLPSKAKVIRHGEPVEIDVAELKIGDVVQVQAGEKIPADGKLTTGSTTVNESLVTGESKLISKGVNDEVIGGSINNDGTFEFKVDKVGNDSYLNKVMNLVMNASNDKSHTQTLADKVAGYLFYAALAGAIIGLVVWMGISGVNVALPIAVTVLIIACPHALGLAIPLVVSRSTALAAKNGLLIRDSNALEHTNKVKFVLMDKTGTLTEGNFKLNIYRSYDPKYSDDQILSLAGSLEETSSHPLAKGVMDAISTKKIKISEATNVQQIPGFGVTGDVDGEQYQLVSVKYFETHHIDFDEAKFEKLIADKNNSISFLLTHQRVIGAIGEGDEIKANSKKMVTFLRQRGIQPVMLTGDNRAIAKSVADRLGIQNYRFELLPEDKQKIVAEYQQKGQTMFIGDGVNDAPSLSRADVGVAIGAGTDVAIDSADIVLVRSDPKNVIDLFGLAQKTATKMKQNLWWGAGYNIVAIPLAAGILAPVGIMLSPMVGAVLMSLSTVVVSVNALTLKV